MSEVIILEQDKRLLSLSAPRKSTGRIRLEVKSGISNFVIGADPSISDLFQARFIGLLPKVSISKDIVNINYRLSLSEWFAHTLLSKKQIADMHLNVSVPWDINLCGGVVNMRAELTSVKLQSLLVSGGISQTDILLPHPFGTVPIQILGGVNRLNLELPDGVKARLTVNNGANNLSFGRQFFGALGGNVVLETPGYEDTTNKYEIFVFSGVDQMTVRTQEY